MESYYLLNIQYEFNISISHQFPHQIIDENRSYVETANMFVSHPITFLLCVRGGLEGLTTLLTSEKNAEN